MAGFISVSGLVGCGVVGSLASVGFIGIGGLWCGWFVGCGVVWVVVCCVVLLWVNVVRGWVAGFNMVSIWVGL